MEKTKSVKIKLPGTVLTSIMWLGVGLILLIFPGQSLNTICRIAGILVMIVGLIQLCIGLMGAGSMPGQLSTVMGGIIAVIGLVIIIRPDLLVSLLPFAAGTVIIIHGIASLVNSVQLLGAKDRYWWVGILLSVVMIGLGAVLFFRSYEAAEFTARIIGIFMIYGSLSNLWINYRKASADKARRQEEEALDVEAKITDAD